MKFHQHLVFSLCLCVCVFFNVEMASLPSDEMVHFNYKTKLKINMSLACPQPGLSFDDCQPLT